jgi:hypothetical protein
VGSEFSPPTTPPASASPYPWAPAPPARGAKGKRVTASTLLLIAAILLAVSMGISWWSISGSGGGSSGTVNLLPGGSYSTTGTFGGAAGTGSTTYSSVGLVKVGQLYETVLGVGLLATFAAFGAMGLGYVGAFGVFRSRIPLRITLILTLIAFVAAVLPPALLATAQPGAFKADGAAMFGGTGGGGSCAAGASPCNAFWGTAGTGGVTVSWGADVGWYLSIAAAVLVFVALMVLWSSRRQPFTRDELWMAAPHPSAPPPGFAPWPNAPPSPSPPGSTSTSSPYPSAGPSPMPPPPGGFPVASVPACPRCGAPSMYVAQYYRYYCTNCRAYL